MKQTHPPFTFSLLIILICAGVLSAHHSLSTEYDEDAPVRIQGVVKQVEWTNPHSYLQLETSDSDGQTVVWRFEGFPPLRLSDAGWEKGVTLQPGDVVTVEGWRAKDGTTSAHGTIVTWEDGRRMLFGVAMDGKAQGKGGKGKGRRF